MTDAILLVACALLAGAVGALAVAVRRLRRSVAELGMRVVESRGLVTGARAPSSTNGLGGSPSTGETVRDVAADGGRHAAGSATEEEYVITRLGIVDAEAEALEQPDARLFADLLLRESVVKAASFAHGVRRGLSPESRNRIWFEMRREVKRVRRARKAEEREAIREWKARQRAAQRDGRRDGQREDDAA